jgi:hypothetical protein
MAAHLRKCLPRVGDGATVDGLLIRIEAMGAPMYWMDCVARFGSTTALVISHSGHIGAVLDKPVRVAARNEPPVWACDACGEPATAICTQCIYDERGFCCAKHATKHPCGTDMLLPVVNSPRMGVCGYAGEG